MVKLKNIVFLLCGAIGVSCSTFDLAGIVASSSTVQERFAHSTDLPDASFYKDRYVVAGAGYCFVVGADFHLKKSDEPRWGNFVRQISQNSAFGIFLGDFMEQSGSSLSPIVDTVRRYNYPMFAAIGNHDVYQQGYQEHYRPLLGPTCYWFRVVNAGSSDLFVVLDSANGTLGVEQTQWLEGVLARERSSNRHCFVCTHANFFSPAGYVDIISTYTMEEQMRLLHLFSQHRVTAVFSGHSHLYDYTRVGGVDYWALDSWIDSKYLTVRCGATGLVAIER